MNCVDACSLTCSVITWLVLDLALSLSLSFSLSSNPGIPAADAVPEGKQRVRRQHRMAAATAQVGEAAVDIGLAGGFSGRWVPMQSSTTASVERARFVDRARTPGSMELTCFSTNSAHPT